MSITLRKRIKLSDKNGSEGSIFHGLWNFILGALKAVGSIEARMEKSLERHKQAVQRWLVKVIVMGLSVFMSLAFLVLGVFFVAIDYGGIPRGIVFICGGLLGLVILGLRVSSK